MLYIAHNGKVMHYDGEKFSNLVMEFEPPIPEDIETSFEYDKESGCVRVKVTNTVRYKIIKSQIKPASS